jgi:hypothetical protein
MDLRKGISQTESLRPPRVPEHGVPQGVRDADVSGNPAKPRRRTISVKLAMGAAAVKILSRVDHR